MPLSPKEASGVPSGLILMNSSVRLDVGEDSFVEAGVVKAGSGDVIVPDGQDRPAAEEVDHVVARALDFAQCSEGVVRPVRREEHALFETFDADTPDRCKPAFH